jgi:hypothetical protein
MLKGWLGGVLEHVASLVDDEDFLATRSRATRHPDGCFAHTAVAIMRCIQYGSSRLDERVS